MIQDKTWKKNAELKALIARMLLVGCEHDDPVTWHLKAREEMFVQIGNKIDEL